MTIKLVVIFLECRNCPYGKEDFERRMCCYEKIIAERGIPNDIYHYLKPEDAPDEFEQFLWCDKVGGKVYWAGRCSDAYIQSEISQNRSKQKRRNKRERDQKYKNHLKFLSEYPSGYPSPAVYRDKIFIRGQGYIENPKPYYKRYYREQRAKYIKRMSNKTIRRYKGDIPKKGNWCHKLYDFWYEMY